MIHYRPMSLPTLDQSIFITLWDIPLGFSSSELGIVLLDLRRLDRQDELLLDLLLFLCLDLVLDLVRPLLLDPP